MTGKNREMISPIVLWYEDSFRVDCPLAYCVHVNWERPFILPHFCLQC